MKKTVTSLTVGWFSIFFSTMAWAYAAPPKVCTYSTDPKGVQLVWTAFKFTNKTPVKGHFTKQEVTEVKGNTLPKSLAALMLGLSMDIDASSVETNDPARNATISQFFFAKFAPASRLHAAVARVAGNDAKGTVRIRITMNGATRWVPFAYTATPDGAFEGKATIDLMNFRLAAAFHSLHEACKDKHTGTDGVSKTWTQVDLVLTGHFQKSCS